MPRHDARLEPKPRQTARTAQAMPVALPVSELRTYALATIPIVATTTVVRVSHDSGACRKQRGPRANRTRLLRLTPIERLQSSFLHRSVGSDFTTVARQIKITGLLPCRVGFHKEWRTLLVDSRGTNRHALRRTLTLL